MTVQVRVKMWVLIAQVTMNVSKSNYSVDIDITTLKPFSLHTRVRVFAQMFKSPKVRSRFKANALKKLESFMTFGFYDQN